MWAYAAAAAAASISAYGQVRDGAAQAAAEHQRLQALIPAPRPRPCDGCGASSFDSGACTYCRRPEPTQGEAMFGFESPFSRKARLDRQEKARMELETARQQHEADYRRDLYRSSGIAPSPAPYSPMDNPFDPLNPLNTFSPLSPFYQPSAYVQHPVITPAPSPSYESPAPSHHSSPAHHYSPPPSYEPPASSPSYDSGSSFDYGSSPSPSSDGGW